MTTLEEFNEQAEKLLQKIEEAFDAAEEAVHELITLYEKEVDEGLLDGHCHQLIDMLDIRDIEILHAGHFEEYHLKDQGDDTT